MQLILFTGLQASGKSTFYARRFADTHVRINMDMLKTRYREQLIFEACLEAKQPLVIDNTNPTPQERARYIAPGKSHGFAVHGYYFQSKLESCRQRNEQRSASQIVPLAGLLSTYNRMILPAPQEGFDCLYYVRMNEGGGFLIEEWSDEI